MYQIDIRRYSAAIKRPPMIQFVCDEPRGEWTERDGDWDDADMSVGPL